MRLRDVEDQQSAYVLYSDLLFNLLILFSVFALTPVLRPNAGMRNVAGREHDPSQRTQADAAIERDARRERDQAQQYLIAIGAASSTLRPRPSGPADGLRRARRRQPSPVRL